MQQFEFQTVLPADATVTVPPEIAVQVEPNRPIRIVMLVPDPQEDREWSAQQFSTPSGLAMPLGGRNVRRSGRSLG